MKESSFPELITKLPQADISFPGVMGWISQAVDHQVLFLDINAAGEVAPHSHGEQWGIVVEGEMDLTIDGKAERFGPGDSYHIPAGVVHSARFLSHVRAIDVFEEVDRYKAKK